MILEKIRTKSMRLITIFQPTRSIAISLKKKNPIMKRVSNKNFSLDTKQYEDEIYQRGFSSIFKIPKDSLKRLIDFCNSSAFYGQYSNGEVYIDYDNPIKPDSSEDLWYLNKTIYNDCKEARDLAHNRDLVNVASAYLGREPKLFNTHAWWSFPPKSDGYVHNYGFHYDIDSYKFVKFFIYLTDVDADSGPHVIVANTHKSKTWFQKKHRRLTEGQANKMFNKDDIHILTGEAGDGFFEDTFAYHKGTTPRKSRLIFQVEYSI